MRRKPITELAAEPNQKYPREQHMPQTFGWEDAEEIGIQLSEKHPKTDPLTVRFTDLLKLVTELPGFTGDAKASSEGKLEAIQMAWHEEYQDRTH
jgi:FeS assembly protein IscX